LRRSCITFCPTTVVRYVCAMEISDETIGIATNNVAEYGGLIAGLQKALDLHVPEVEVVSDSELMVKQMRGEYRVKNEALRSLSVEAGRLARQLPKVEYRHVPRADNELADRLVHDALDGPVEPCVRRCPWRAVRLAARRH